MPRLRVLRLRCRTDQVVSVFPIGHLRKCNHCYLWIKVRFHTKADNFNSSLKAKRSKSVNCQTFNVKLLIAASWPQQEISIQSFSLTNVILIKKVFKPLTLILSNTDKHLLIVSFHGRDFGLLWKRFMSRNKNFPLVFVHEVSEGMENFSLLLLMKYTLLDDW